MKIYVNKEISNHSIDNVTGIVLSGNNFIPPHLGLVISGNYFSCSANSVKTNVPFSRIFNKLKRRNHKLLIAELDIPISIQKSREIFNDYGVLCDDKTCLGPVKKTIEFHLNQNFKSNFIFELLPVLEEKRIIKSYLQFNLDAYISNNGFNLPTYTKEEVLDCIRELQILNVR
ncbi:MAG: hypothetical protein CL848_02895 [Crocinitomicaceae bacterium]|nr:hypothetical protein [Crocinitomicaceae bacterium]